MVPTTSMTYAVCLLLTDVLSALHESLVFHANPNPYPHRTSTLENIDPNNTITRNLTLFFFSY